MKNMNEKLAAELVDAIQAAVENSQTLAITTGDTDFILLSNLLTMLLVAKTKGDLQAIASAVIPVLSAAIDKNNATEDLLNQISFN